MAADTDNALISVQEGLDFLGLGTTTASTANNDDVIDLINVVSWRFNAETGRNLKSREYTSAYDGNGTSKLYLNNWPISSTTITITINANRDFTDTDDQVTSTDVMLDTGSGEVRLDGDTFTKGERNVQVAYSAGYTTSGAFDLIYAAKEFLQILWNRKTAKDPLSVRTEAYEGISRTFEPEFPWSVKKILDMYREGTAY
jgi:hypothetical protein